jgi:acetate kinase
MHEPILVLNAGSSSIKFSVFESLADRSLSAGAHGQVEGIGTSPHLKVSDEHGNKLADGPVAGVGHAGAMAAIHDWLSAHAGRAVALKGVGHRVVHGGSTYSKPVLIDSKVMADLEALIPLAPLHEPHEIAVIRAVSAIAPNVPQIACFDTAFHRTQPNVAQLFAIPRELTAKGVRRYGFHGLSYEYIVSALPEVMPDARNEKLVVAHLGNGASMCAIYKGSSVASTMGFTAVDGLPMGTRTGALDPGVILYLLQHERMDAQAIEQLIYRRSGLLGVSGISNDMRTLETSNAPAAKEAVDLFVYRIGRELGSLAAALGGLDALVFTAGIGENSAEIRARACREAGWLGITLDEKANAKGGPRISSPNSAVSAWVIPTDENLMIARHTSRLLGADGETASCGTAVAAFRDGPREKQP